jgi:hypothetical protein
MLRYAIAIALTLVAWAAVAADNPPFEKYPVDVYSGPVVKPVLDTADKREFRTRITEAAKGPVNFAGKFILALWGCGASCSMGATINAETGEVAFLDWTICCDQGDGERVDFRANSTLIVLRGLLNEEGENKAHMFEFDGTFKPVAERHET